MEKKEKELNTILFLDLINGNLKTQYCLVWNAIKNVDLKIIYH
ncbi:hypothetical protein [Methanocaldococcus sp.]